MIRHRLALVRALSLAFLAGAGAAIAPAQPLALPETARPVHREMLQRMLADEGRPGLEIHADPSVAICWTVGSDPDVAATFDEALEHKGISLFRLDDGDRWGTTATDGSGLSQGDPTVLTWGFIPDGTAIDGFIGEPNAPSDLIAFLDGIYGAGPGGSDLTQRPWFTYFEQIFDTWASRTGVRYVYEPNDDGVAQAYFPGQLGVRADVRIGGHLIDGNSNVLAYNFFPNTGDMVIDTADNFYGNTTGNSIRLRNVLAHEHGHGLGLSHVCPVNQTKLMEPFVSTAFDGVQFDDEMGANRGYGDTDEAPVENDSRPQATDLGSFGQPDSFSLDRSVDDNQDSDWFAFTVPADTEVSLVLAPRGSPYLEGPQNPNGSCTPGTTFDPANRLDLELEVYDTSGGLLAAANGTSAGNPETLDDVSLPDGAGTYYVRVLGPSANEVQLYSLDAQFAAAAPVNQPPAAVCRDVFSCDGNVIPADVDDGSTDPDGDSLTVSLEPAGPYGPGATAVSLVVSDGDLSDTCTATVTVNQAPTAVARNLNLEGMGAGCTVSVPADSLDDGSSDPEGQSLSFSAIPPGPYAEGSTPVEFVVVDSCGAADTTAATVTVTCFSGPELAVDPSAVSFTTVPVGDTTCAPVWIRNTGDQPLTVDSVTGCDTGNFSVDLGGLVSPVAPGDSTSFTVCFQPQVSGPDSCTVSVATPDSTALVSVTAVGAPLSIPGPGAVTGVLRAAVVPNPLRARAEIRFELPVSGAVRIEVFDVRGRRVRSLAHDEALDAGFHVREWDGRGDHGSRMVAGIYFVRVALPGMDHTVRAVLVR